MFETVKPLLCGTKIMVVDKPVIFTTLLLQVQVMGNHSTLPQVFVSAHVQSDIHQIVESKKHFLEL